MAWERGETVIDLKTLDRGRFTHIEVTARSTYVFAVWDAFLPDEETLWVKLENACKSNLGHIGNPCVFCDYERE